MHFSALAVCVLPHFCLSLTEKLYNMEMQGIYGTYRFIYLFIIYFIIFILFYHIYHIFYPIYPILSYFVVMKHVVGWRTITIRMYSKPIIIYCSNELLLSVSIGWHCTMAFFLYHSLGNLLK